MFLFLKILDVGEFIYSSAKLRKKVDSTKSLILDWIHPVLHMLAGGKLLLQKSFFFESSSLGDQQST